MSISERILIKINEAKERSGIKKKIKEKAKTIAVHALLLKYADTVYPRESIHWMKELYHRYNEIKELIKDKRMINSTEVRKFLWEEQLDENFFSKIRKEVSLHDNINLPNNSGLSEVIDNVYFIFCALTEDDATFDEFSESINQELEISGVDQI